MPRGPSSVIARRPFVSVFIVDNCFALSMQQSTTNTPQSNYLVLSMLQSTTDTPQATRSDARASGGAYAAAAVQRDRDSASGTDRYGPVAAGPSVTAPPRRWQRWRSSCGDARRRRAPRPTAHFLGRAPLRLRHNPQRILEVISSSLWSAISLQCDLVLRSAYGSLRSAISLQSLGALWFRVTVTADIGITMDARIPVPIGMPSLRTFELHCAWGVDLNAANCNSKEMIFRSAPHRPLLKNSFLK